MSTALNLSEIRRLIGAQVPPEIFCALDTVAQIDLDHIGKARTALGQEAVTVPMLVVLPRDLFKPAVLDKHGNEPSPLNGACPVAEVRIIVQVAMLDPDVYARLNAEPETVPELPVLRKPDAAG